MAATGFLSGLFSMFTMFSKDIGIDLGTANTLVFMRGKGIVMREPSVVAVDVRTDEVLAVGKQAKEMLGRTPGSIVAVRPLKDGVIADFDVTAAMLKYFIKKALKSNTLNRPRIVVCIPSGVTEVERRAVEDAARQAGSNNVDLIEEPMAAAIGAGLPVGEPTGCMVVDIGGGTSEVAVISLGDIVTSVSVRMAGDKFDEAIVSYVKKKYNLLIGERTAEEIKIRIGSAFPTEETINAFVEIKGRNLVDGLPKNVTIHADEVREALADSVMIVVDAIKDTLEKTPPSWRRTSSTGALCSPAAALCCGAWTSWWLRRRASPSMWRSAPWTAWWRAPAKAWKWSCPRTATGAAESKTRRVRGRLPGAVCLGQPCPGTRQVRDVGDCQGLLAVRIRF